MFATKTKCMWSKRQKKVGDINTFNGFPAHLESGPKLLPVASCFLLQKNKSSILDYINSSQHSPSTTHHKSIPHTTHKLKRSMSLPIYKQCFPGPIPPLPNTILVHKTYLGNAIKHLKVLVVLLKHEIQHMSWEIEGDIGQMFVKKASILQCEYQCALLSECLRNLPIIAPNSK